MDLVERCTPEIISSVESNTIIYFRMNGLFRVAKLPAKLPLPSSVNGKSLQVHTRHLLSCSVYLTDSEAIMGNSKLIDLINQVGLV